MRWTRTATAMVVLTLVGAACGGADDDASTTSTTAAAATTVASDAVSDADAIAACIADARVGLAVVGAAMTGITDQEPEDVADERWETLLEDDAVFASALDELADLDRTCETSDDLSVQVVDRADEVLPMDLNDAIVWIEGIGSTVGIARTVAPETAEARVQPAGGEQVAWPPPLDVGGLETCDAVIEATASQTLAYIDMWSSLSPTAFAAERPDVDFGLDMQQSRLRAAQLECDLAAHASEVIVALATTASESFMSRGLRLTYAEWILTTMLKPTLTDADVVVQPVGESDGSLSGFAIHNRADATRTGISVRVGDQTVVQDLVLDPGISEWIAFPLVDMEDVVVDWDR